MDKLIKYFDSVSDGDLTLCPARGVTYQTDMKHRISYDAVYFEKCASYDPAIADRVNAGRLELVLRHHTGPLLDVGVGSGGFISHCIGQNRKAFGYDINRHAVSWLRERNRYSESWDLFKAFTFWDTIEHVEDPHLYFNQVARDATVFVSVPIFDSLDSIRQSKHYRPGEHLYYWTREGFIAWMKMYEFRLLEESTHEVDAGREGVASFAFKRDWPGYNELLVQYVEMHARRHYGASANLYLDIVASAIRQLQPTTILDYGCGRSDLISHFWLDGARRIERYDPAIPDFKMMPSGKFDLAVCCDVMEHIPIASVDRVLAEIKEKSSKVFFVISTKPSRAVLPNGSNAHVTLLTRNEWTRWIRSTFGTAHEIPTQWAHVLVLKTF